MGAPESSGRSSRNSANAKFAEFSMGERQAL
jgi:hypothetical protein